jgi:hypothetical protein
MRTRCLTTAAAALFVVSATVARAGQGASDPRWSADGRKHILELTRWLEEHPLEDPDKSKGREVLQWWTEVPDLTLSVCSGLLPNATNEKIKSILIGQAIFGAGALLIEHPDADEQALVSAGIASALRAYRHAVAADPSYRDALFDSLASDPGQAKAYTDKKVAECAKEKEKKK